MQYSCEVVINLPRKKVINIFDDAENLTKWMKGLQSFEHINGVPGQPGAESRLLFNHKGRHLEMIETIESKNLPEELSGTYRTKGIINKVSNHFYEESTDRTRWVADYNLQCSGLMKLMIFFMRQVFPKQTKFQMENFKKFAEET